MRISKLHSVVVLLLLTTIAHAENWPQWRGPNLNGFSTEKNLPARWTTEENVVWKLALPGWSGSTPIIWRDRVFLNVAEGNDLYLWCINRTKGELLWKKLLGGGNVKMRKQNMSSPSPVTDGRSVWVMTGTGVLKAFDFKGNELWARDIQKDYGKFGLNWGYASSPLLYEDSLFVQVLHGMRTDDPSYVLKIDPMTGKTIWRVERRTDAVFESPDSYTTPAWIEANGRAELIITGGDVVSAHDPETGREYWRADVLNPNRISSYRIVASPLVAGGLVLGIIGAAWLDQALQNQIYGLQTLDPVVTAIVISILGLIALAACWLPARRAMHVDPFKVLNRQ